MKVPSLWKGAVGLALAAVAAWGASPVMGAGDALTAVPHTAAPYAAAQHTGEALWISHSDEARQASESAGEPVSPAARVQQQQAQEAQGEAADRTAGGEAGAEAGAEVGPEEARTEAGAEKTGGAGKGEGAPNRPAGERVEKLQRWDALKQRRADLRRELAQVERELRALKEELWPERTRDWSVPRGGDDGGSGEAQGRRGEWVPGDWIPQEEWESLRAELRERTERFLERLNERLAAMGEDLLPWVPDAVVEALAQRTGYTPDEVRDLIRTGAWDQLLRRMDWSGEGDSGAETAPEGAAESKGGSGTEPEAGQGGPEAPGDPAGDGPEGAGDAAPVEASIA